MALRSSPKTPKRVFTIAPHPHPDGPVPTRHDSGEVKPVRPYDLNPLIEMKDPNDPVHLDEIVSAVAAHRAKPDPVNEYIIRRSESYKDEFPELLSKNMEAIREFVLKQALPLVTAVPNALQDVSDIVRSVTDEEPDLTRVQSLLDGLTAYAIRVRALSFIAELSNLTPGEAALLRSVDFVMQTGAANGSSDLQAIVRQMLEVPNVPGRKKDRPEALVRKVHPPKGSRVDPGLPGSADGPKRRRAGEQAREEGPRGRRRG